MAAPITCQSSNVLVLIQLDNNGGSPTIVDKRTLLDNDNNDVKWEFNVQLLPPFLS